MVVLDVDHPDIEEFVETKAREEDKIRALRDAGFDMDLGGKDITSVQYQNANNSVRVTDEFMRAVEDGTSFGLRARQTGEVIEEVDARELWRKIAQAAWECADPGLQYDDTINDWHTNPETGRITASNPCSEYMSLDNSSCNLASLNLMKFLKDDDTFDAALIHTTEPIAAPAIELVPLGEESLEQDGAALTVSGWGTEFFMSPFIPAQLKAVDVEAVSDGSCTTNGLMGFQADSEMCAETLGGDSCQGDSGGPLFGSLADGRLVQVGIVSYGLGCATPEFPGVYGEVNNPSIHDFITSTVG